MKRQRCKECGKTKPLEDFGLDKTTTSGRKGKCRVCQRAWLRDYRLKNREALQERAARYALEQSEVSKVASEKTCTQCNQLKDLEQFNRNRRGRLGRAAMCKACASEYDKARKSRDKDKVRARHRDYYRRTKDEFNAKLKKRRDANIEEFRARERERRATDPERFRETDRRWRKRNIEELRKRDRDRYQREKEKRTKYRRKYVEANRTRLYKENTIRNQRRFHTDIEYRIRKVLSSRVNTALRGRGYKHDSTIKMVGCSRAVLLSWLEFQFDGKMHWENYGSGGWQVDHWYPISMCDITRKSHQMAVCNYRNLRPAWAEDNLRKKNAVELKAQHLFDALVRVFDEKNTGGRLNEKAKGRVV